MWSCGGILVDGATSGSPPVRAVVWRGGATGLDWDTEYQGQPTVVPERSDVNQVAVGGPSFACARVAAGPIQCWGTNENCQLGNGARGDEDAAERAAPLLRSGGAPATD